MGEKKSVEPGIAVISEFQRLVDRLTPPVGEKHVKPVEQIVARLVVAANHLAAKTQRQEPTK